MNRLALACVFTLACAAHPPAAPVTPAAVAPEPPTAAAAPEPPAPAPAPAAPAEVVVPVPADVAAPPAGAERTASGLASKVLSPGTGKVRPLVQDQVKVHYSGWTSDGRMFDSSVVRGEPLTFPLRGVILGWSEGVQLMVVGEKRRLWIPEALAYGGRPGAPAGMLVFDVELLDIVPGPAPLPAPADVAAAPADAKRDKGGFAWKVTQKGKGKAHPKATDHAHFQFTAWTSGGVMLVSSVQDHGPFEVTIDEAVGAWKAMLPQMVVGEHRLIWAPASLAIAHPHGVEPGDPVVVELELLSFVTPPATPKDLARPPADAEKSAWGLASKVLKKGKGTTHPTADSNVTLHFTGWTADGKIFDSSVLHGEPEHVLLRSARPGWAEGVPLMVVGEKRRFWVPAALGYQGEYGGPKGALVFDVELLAIDPAPAPAADAPAPR
jgi:FKBP-type peptidyl-prolyl cis-trans isomerase